MNIQIVLTVCPQACGKFKVQQLCCSYLEEQQEHWSRNSLSLLVLLMEGVGSEAVTCVSMSQRDTQKNTMRG